MDRLKQLLHRLRKDAGQAMVEYILVLPNVFLLVMNLINFGTFTCAWIGVANAARAAADYAVLGGLASVGGVVTYSPNSNPGSTLTVTVTYTYDPLRGYFRKILNKTLGSTSEGVITF